MKKTIMTLLMAVGLAVGMTANAETTDNKYKAGWQWWYNHEQDFNYDNAVTVAAQYDGERLIKVLDVQEHKKGDDVKLELTSDSDADVKIMLWDSINSMTPLEEPLYVKMFGKNVELDVAGWDNDYFDGGEEEAYEKLTRDYGSGLMIFYDNADKTGKPSIYYFSDNFKLYVNGKEVTVNAENVSKYIFNNNIGKIKFEDTDFESEGVSILYDNIYVDYCGTAIVDSVRNGKISFSDYDCIINPEKFIDTDTDESYAVIKRGLDTNGKKCEVLLNNQPIGVDEIQTNDVLSITFDTEAGFENSDFYNIQVSRNTVEGMVSNLNWEDGLFSVDNNVYALIDTLSGEREDSHSWNPYLYLGESYKIYLDVLGRAAKAERDYSNINYGIVHRAFFDNNAEERKIVVIDKMGNKKTLVVDQDMSDDKFDEIQNMWYGNFDASGDYTNVDVDAPSNIENVYGVENRVIMYKTNSKGVVKSVEPLKGNARYGVYDAKNQTIGSLSINKDTFMIAKGDNNKLDYHHITTEQLIDGKEYIIFGYDKDNNKDTYPYMLIIGNIVEEQEDILSEDIYGILHRAWFDEIDDKRKAQIADSDGNIQTIDISDYIADEDFDNLMRLSYSNFEDTNDYTSLDSAAPSSVSLSYSVEKRVISYKVNQNGELVVFENKSGDGSFAEYKDGKLGEIALTDDVKLIYKGSDGKCDYHRITKDDLKDGTKYITYKYNDDFVLIIDGIELKDEDDKISDAQYGVIHRVWFDSNDDEYHAHIVDADGEIKSFIINEKFAEDNWDIIEMSYDRFDSDGDYSDVDSNAPSCIDNVYGAERRVIEYKTNSKGKIVNITSLEGTAKYGKYNKESNTIAGLAINDNTTIICKGDNSKNDYSYVNHSVLNPSASYLVYGYGKKDDGYSFILVLGDIGQYNTDTRFAVVSKVTEAINENYDVCNRITMFTADSKEEVVLNTDERDYKYTDLQQGDVIIYKTNSDGDITGYELIFSSGTDAADYDDWMAENIEILDEGEIEDDYFRVWSDMISCPSQWECDKDVKLVFGPVVDRSSSNVSIATAGDIIDGNLLEYDEVEALDYASDVNIIVYNFNNSRNERLYIGTPNDVIKTDLTEAWTDENKNFLNIDDWDAESKPAIALAKLVEDEITDLFVIIPKD